MTQSLGGRGRYNELAGQSLNRLAGISDGIFSVGMTLLVLGLALPAAAPLTTEADLWRALVLLAPTFLIYLMSFITLGIFWVGQQTQLSQLARSNRHYTWIQLAFLFGVTLVPFSTGLLAHSPTLQREVATLLRGRVVIAQGLYAFATALGLFFPTWVSIGLIVLIQLNYVIAPRIPLLERF